MNWFLKLSQVWKIESDGSFASDVKKFYELEYKRSFLLNNNFKGLPQRKENILKKIDQELQKVFYQLKIPLKNTLETWLQNHAITNASFWANQRFLDEQTDEENLDNMLMEWRRYDDNAKEEQIPYLTKNFNSLSDLYYELFEEQKEMQKEDIYYEAKQNNQQYDESIIDQIDNSVQNNDYLVDLLNYESIISYLERFGTLSIFIIEFYEKIVFPKWFAYWQPQGIEKTRKTIEQIYQELINAKDIKSNIIAINLAINAAHQTGNMIDYLETYGNVDHNYHEHGSLKELLDYLSNDNNLDLIIDWEEQMEKIGVEKKYENT